MLLSELFDYLNYGELAQISLGNANDEGISEENYPSLITHINLALIALHREFPLRENSAVIQQYSNITKYELKTEFSATNGSASTKYILDSAEEPFIGRVLKIHKVTSSNSEIEIELNNLNEIDNPIISLSHNTLKVTNPDAAHTLTVSYREGPEKISADSLDPSSVEIPLPETLIEPLLYFVAARAHARTPALDGQQTLTSMYMQKYEMVLAKLLDKGIVQNHYLANERIEREGWV